MMHLDWRSRALRRRLGSENEWNGLALHARQGPLSEHCVSIMTADQLERFRIVVAKILSGKTRNTGRIPIVHAYIIIE